jgi:branched-chain amino acid transport system permease protein
MHGLRVIVRSLLPFAVAILFFGLVQDFLTPSQTVILIVAGVNVILAVSLNVVNGFTGQFSLGHAGFMAVGAYTAAKITTAMHGLQIIGLSAGMSDQVVFLLALVAGMILAGLMGFVVGMPSLRLRGDYLAIVTLGFNEIIRVIIENTPFLGEATGISGLPRRTTVLWVGLGAVVTISMARRLVGSSHGRALLAIREDEIAAEAMGVDTTGYKVRAFVISSAFAGLAGGLLVHLIQLCTPRSFTFVKSIEVVAMVVLGGMGSVTGSVVSALTLTFALEALRGVQQYRMIMYALLLIVLMLTRPEGIFGTREIWDLIPGRKKKAPAPGSVEPGTGDGRRLS